MTNIFFMFFVCLLCLQQATAQKITAQEDTSVKIKNLNEVIITGVSAATEKQKFSMPVSILTQKDFLQNASTNIIDAIAAVPGVSQITRPCNFKTRGEGAWVQPCNCNERWHKTRRPAMGR